MSIDNIIWDIRGKVFRKLGDTRKTEIAMDPLIWYVKTGRAPFEFERRIKACTPRQQSTIASRLIKYSSGDYQCAINSICNYIGFQRES